MKRVLATVAGITVLCIVVSWRSFAQYPEDALRLATPGIGVGVRALGMGNAYTGVANDFSALYWNPAGLAQMHLSEISGGLRYFYHSNTSTFFGNSFDNSASGTELNNFSVVFPSPVKRGAFVIAIGYNRENTFADAVSYTGFNPSYSLIQDSAPDGQPYPYDLANNLGYQIYLADIDTLTGRFISPIRDSVKQSAMVTEGGGLNNWSIGFAVDIAKELSIGGTFTYVAGSYRYDRSYAEEDGAGVYNRFPFDMARWNLQEYIDDDIGGITGKFGLMYRVPDVLRFGLNVKFPTRYSVEETYGQTATSLFDDGTKLPAGQPFTSQFTNNYDVITPWTFNTGLSLMFPDIPVIKWIVRDIVVAGDAEFTDWTTLEFADALPEVMAWNSEMDTIFRPTANFRLGLETAILGLDLRLRGGLMYRQSPYKNDGSLFNSPYDKKYVTAGLGILMGGTVMLDAAYAYGWWEDYRANDITSTVHEQITQQNVMLSISYRF